MEFDYEEIICGVEDLCKASMGESDDDEETLSFCDMLLCDNAGEAAELASTQRVSNPGSSDHQDFHFDLDFGGLISNACQASAADHLIFNGSVLPLSECKVRSFYNDCDSFWQNRVPLNEKLQPLRSDSMESKSSYWTSSISSKSHASSRSFNYSDSKKGLRAENSSKSHASSRSFNYSDSKKGLRAENSSKSHASSRSFNYSASKKGLRAENSSAVNNKSNIMANWTSFSSGSRSKSSSRWLQYFSLGINRTPVMKLEDLRLRQCKRNENGVEKPILKRSVSSYYEEGPTLKKKAATFQQRSKSVKENKRALQTRGTKGFRILDLFTLFNSCRSSINSVINCTKGTAL